MQLQEQLAEEEAAKLKEEQDAKAAAEESDDLTLADRIIELFERPPFDKVKPYIEPLLDALEDRPNFAWVVVAAPVLVLLAIVQRLFKVSYKPLYEINLRHLGICHCLSELLHTYHRQGVECHRPGKPADWSKTLGSYLELHCRLSPQHTAGQGLMSKAPCIWFWMAVNQAQITEQAACMFQKKKPSAATARQPTTRQAKKGDVTGPDDSAAARAATAAKSAAAGAQAKVADATGAVGSDLPTNCMPAIKCTSLSVQIPGAEGREGAISSFWACFTGRCIHAALSLCLWAQASETIEDDDDNTVKQRARARRAD